MGAISRLLSRWLPWSCLLVGMASEGNARYTTTKVWSDGQWLNSPYSMSQKFALFHFGVCSLPGADAQGLAHDPEKESAFCSSVSLGGLAGRYSDTMEQIYRLGFVKKMDEREYNNSGGK